MRASDGQKDLIGLHRQHPRRGTRDRLVRASEDEMTAAISEAGYLCK